MTFHLLKEKFGRVGYESEKIEILQIWLARVGRETTFFLSPLDLIKRKYDPIAVHNLIYMYINFDLENI